MGLIQHHCVIGTTEIEEKFRRAIHWVYSLEPKLTKLFVTNENGFANRPLTIIMTPDGSKEGWTESQLGDVLRHRFKEILKAEGIPFIEIGFGDLGAQIIESEVTDYVTVLTSHYVDLRVRAGDSGAVVRKELRL